jgi:drug/metabolite transporter (DMT)-like permease
MRHPAWRGPLLIATLALIWGSNFAWIKVSLEAFTPTQLTFGRMLLGALVLCAVLAIQRHPLPTGWRTWTHLTIAALIANALPYYLFALGETRVDSSTAGIANATTPLWTLAIVAALRQETVSARRLTGFALGLCGCVVLLNPWNTGTVDIVGAFACLSAALSYAVSYVYMARYLITRAITPAALSAAQLLAATTWTLLALAPRLGPRPVAQMWPWLALLILGVLGTGAAYGINYTLIRVEGAVGASTVIYLVPVVSIVFGTALLLEPVTARLMGGTLLVLLGVHLTRSR